MVKSCAGSGPVMSVAIYNGGHHRALIIQDPSLKREPRRISSDLAPHSLVILNTLVFGTKISPDMAPSSP